MSDTRLKICLRGLPANTELRSIQKELRERGFDSVFMRHVAARDKGPGVFCVQLQVTPGIEKVFDIKKMLGAPIRVEAWHGRQGPPQCQRCQGFSHSATECLREYRCVHCARPHPSRQCNRPYDIPTCANCRGPHAANDFSCPAMRREQIAKAGKVLRTTGYTLATPKPVEETNAPSSLMAEANAKWTETKRKRRKNRTLGKSEASTSPDRDLHIQEAQQSIAALSIVKESQPTRKVVSELKEEGVHEFKAEPQRQNTLASPAVKSQPAKHDVKPVHVSPVKEPSVKKNQLKPSLNGSISKENPLAVSPQQRSLTSHGNKCGPAIQESQQVSVKLIEETQPKENTVHQLSAVPVVNEPVKIETTMNPEAIRAKVAYECVLILQKVLDAIQQGQNPVPIILESLAKLYQGA